MMTRLLWSGLSLVLLGTSSWAAVTPRHGLNLTSQELLNSNFIKLDSRVRGNVAGDCPILKTVLTSNPTEAGATNDFANLFDGTASTTEANEDDFVTPVALHVTYIRCTVDVAPGAGVDDWKISVRDDGATITPTCSIDETATSCTTSTVSADIAPGSLLNLIYDSSGAGADPAAAGALECQVCFSQIP